VILREKSSASKLLKTLEAAIGIEPMNKAFAELNTNFIHVHLSYLKFISVMV
jgi:hypothetical protein